MKYRPDAPYPEFERPRIEALAELFEQWAKEKAKKPLPNGYSVNHSVFDGFYPFYTQQRPRILFVGWEALGISGDHYIDVLMGVYRSQEKTIGKRPINRDRFHSRLLYIAFGITTGFQAMRFSEWEQIPSATDLAEKVAVNGANGFSYAFMNLSKFSNDSASSQADWDLIEKSLASSRSGSLNFISREIELLQPQIVISMNLMNRICLLGDVKVLERNPRVNSHILNAGEWKGILLLDTFHFSARKKGKEDFYVPIIEAIQAHAHKAWSLSEIRCS